MTVLRWARDDDVAHHQAAFPQEPGNAEGVSLIIESSGIHDAIVTEVSPGGGNRRASKHVVEDLTRWARHLIDRVGSGLFIDHHAQHKFFVIDVTHAFEFFN